VLHGAVDGVSPPQSSEGHSKFFTREYERRVLDDVGHNPAQEAPTVFAEAILDVCRG
jgi:pimeloyl-ACP methyl ester carboxylesterase